MPIYALLQFIVSGTFIGIMIVCLIIAAHTSMRRAVVLLAIICATISSFFALQAYGYITENIHLSELLLKWRHVLIGIFFIALPLFLSSLSRHTFSKRTYFLSAIGGIITIGALYFPAGWSHSHISSVIDATLPWGETVKHGIGPASNYGFIAIFLILFHLANLTYCIYREFPRASIFARVFIFITIVHMLFSLALNAATLLGYYNGIHIAEWFVLFSFIAFSSILTQRLRDDANAHRQIFNGVDDAIIVHELTTGKIVNVNQPAMRLFKQTQAQFLTASIASLFKEKAMPPMPPMPSAVITDNNDSVSQLALSHCNRLDGHSFPVELSTQPSYINGTLCGITTIRDISERIQVENTTLRLQKLLDNSPIPIGANRLDGTLTYTNKAFVDLFKYTHDDLKNIENAMKTLVINPDARQKWATEYFTEVEKCVAEKRPFKPLDVMMTAKDGRELNIEFNSVIIGDEQLAFFVDYSELRRAKDDLIRQGAFNHAIIARAADGVCVCHAIEEAPHVRFTVWNPRMTEITGCDLNFINSNGWYQTLYPDPDVRERAITRMDKMRDGHDLANEEWIITRKDKTKRTVSISTSVIPPGVDGVPHVLAVMRDVTRQRHAELERRQLEAQVQHTQKLESLGVLAGGIAHDFNNILMAILGRSSLISTMVPKQDAIIPHVEAIETASHRAAELCRQMLAYAGKGRFVVEPVRLETLIEEMGRMLEISISKKVVLRYEFAPDLPAINADASQIRQVTMNLITNASESVGDRSGVITVRTGAMMCDQAYLQETYLDDDLPEGPYVFLEVADTGSGMDAKTKQRMFEPFFTTKFTGRGLGMAAVLGIIRGHRAALKVYSEKNRGTTIKVLFPAFKGLVAVSNSAVLNATRTLPTGATILIVDDEETLRALAFDMLTSLGFEALQAADGNEALTLYKEHRDKIACVILDLTMPHMDGEVTFRELRRLNRDVKVIMSSGYNQQEVTQRFVGKGLAGFLQKPYNLNSMVAALQDIFNKPD